MSVYLYALRERGDDEVRYVGITDAPQRRLAQHTAGYNPSQVWRWASRHDVVMDVLARFDTREAACVAEVDEIARRRAAGERLLNVHDGGTGGRWSAESRARLSAALTGRKLSAETRAKLASPEATAARGSRKGQVWTAADRAAHEASVAARTPEQRAEIGRRISAAKMGTPRPDNAERNRRRSWTR